MPRLPFDSDLHVHTNISPCGVRTSTPDKYFPTCKETGIKTIGFSNHFWDSDIPGAPDWYQPLGVDCLMQIREQITDTLGVQTLIGAECEFFGKLALTYEHSKMFDYMLITTSHFHEEVTICDIPLNDYTDAIRLLCQRFLLGVAAGAKLPIPVSMAHIFHPLGDLGQYQDEIIAGISDREFLEMFGFAAESRVAIEVHLPTVKHYKPEWGDYSEQAARMYRLAKKAGCKFTLGSDEHNWESFIHKSRHIRLIAEKIGITEDDMMEI